VAVTPAPSRRRRILEAYRERLQAITGPAGFFTEAGRAVYLGELPMLGTDDPDDAIAILGQQDDWRQQGRAFFVRWPVTIWALTKADRDDPYLALEDVLADIERAVELDDLTLGGLVYQPIVRVAPRLTLPREDGSSVVGAGVTYANEWKEGWGQPEG
jgi:hypothetical protein